MDSCGDTPDVIMSKAGEKKSASMVLYPGDVCFYALRAECGVPSFEPAGTDMDTLAIYTIEYGDNDIPT